MIVDSHCHAWRYWPYEPPVPDPTSRGTVEQLLWEMDQNGVDKAVVIWPGSTTTRTTTTTSRMPLRRFPDRLYQFADVDCRWWETYHQPGAADRLRRGRRRGTDCAASPTTSIRRTTAPGTSRTRARRSFRPPPT